MRTRRYVRLLLSTTVVLATAATVLLIGSATPSQAAELPGAQAAHGSDHALLIKPGGSLWAWGKNDHGQLGNGTLTGSPVALRVGTATGWSAVACGDLFSLGIRSDGSLWAWGENTDGQLGLGDSSDRTTPERVGASSAWVAVAGGDHHTLALRGDGSLWAWGANAYGQLGLGDTTDVQTPTRVGSASDWDAITCGGDFSAAIKTDGTLWMWGLNDDSQLGLGDAAMRSSPEQVGSDTDWTEVRCGDEDTRALKSAGTLWAWGLNNWGQLGLGDTATRTEPIQVGTDSDWEELACGDDHTAAIKANGTLWAWGDNNYGQLGQGDMVSLATPTRVGNESDWSRVLCGDDFTTALRPGGELWGCGDNTSGDLSLGDVANRPSPTLLFAVGDVTPPTLTSLTSSTHPDPAVWYPLADGELAWAWSDASGVAGYRSSLNTVADTQVAIGYPSILATRSFTGQADGTSYFHVRAVDCAGNWAATSTRAVRIDTTAPIVNTERPSAGATYSRGSLVTCAWTASDELSGVAVQTAELDGAPIALGQALNTAATGTHTFAVTAADNAGNVRVSSVTYAVEPGTYVITPRAGAHGSITPATPQTVNEGDDLTFAIVPDAGYHVTDVFVDDVSVGAVTSYLFGNVTENHTISATFGVRTGLWIKPTPSVVTYGRSALLQGELFDTREPVVGLPGHLVTVQYSASAFGPWEDYGTFETSSVAGELGQISPRIAPVSRTYYRLVYVKQSPSPYESRVSDVVKVRVRPALGRPVGPAKVKARRRFSVSGSLRPHFAAGEKTVTVKVYRYRNGRWRYAKALRAVNVDSGSFTKYKLRTRLTTKGKYRFRATAAGGGWATATTSYSKTLVVR